MHSHLGTQEEAAHSDRFRVPQANHGGKKIHGMRPQNKSRSRNKPGGNGNHQNNNQRQQRMGNIINRVFESAGPDGKVRGTPQQIIDKYQALARDAQVSGDRVAAESYLQHSEHYSRLLGEAQRQQMENRSFNPQQEREDGQPRGDDGQPRGDDGYERERRPQPAMPMPVASGLTTIDTLDTDDLGGPIETPEGRRTPVDEPAPLVRMAPVEPRPAPSPRPQFEAVNGGDAPAPEAQAAEPPAKRPRPRRRPKAEAPVAEPLPQAE